MTPVPDGERLAKLEQQTADLQAMSLRRFDANDEKHLTLNVKIDYLGTEMTRLSTVVGSYVRFVTWVGGVASTMLAVTAVYLKEPLTDLIHRVFH